ncbi:MAG: FAD-dependent oxidoreductase [Planctomycetes bacterium]|nr:FAD-dependent oxidoreductase [Planctomycetota bacterium]MBL7040963.1 FAD-dependent oxidoreductase [Pirellulaceae bacterium]
MKYLPAILFPFLIALDAQAVEVLVEAESFDDPGGWMVDAQFIDQMGSPYLLAHGLGIQVANAKTTVAFPDTGTYRLWVRTKDWVPSHHPGRFRVAIDGKELATEFGTVGDGWVWQDGGLVEVAQQSTTIELRDLTGFDGRCDALLFTTDSDFRPPAKPDESMAEWRRGLLALPDVPPAGGSFDVVVVGGGVPGCSAALTAARLGLRVALVQNRPVLGGNSSSEIGIRPAGLDRSVVTEVVGAKREEVILAEPNIHLLLGWHAFRVTTEGSRIVSVDAKNTRTSEERRFNARTLVDCTGDGWIGYRAGAEYRMGREARDEFDESLAPEKADRMTHGATLFFKIAIDQWPVPFPDVPWAREVAGDHLDPVSNHSWEYGHLRDMIGEAEEIRDHLLSAIYGTFANVKQKFPQKASKARLSHVGYVAARGESRRLMGDYILNENDIRTSRKFPDAVATGSLVFCLHYPGEKHDFRNKMDLIPVKPYGIPFRCLYSRNIDNLMMAGRDASATHIAYSSIKLMKTGGHMGVAVGAAAALCKKHRTTPRGVHEKHLEELKDIVYERGDYENALAGEVRPRTR